MSCHHWMRGAPLPDLPTEYSPRAEVCYSPTFLILARTGWEFKKGHTGDLELLPMYSHPYKYRPCTRLGQKGCLYLRVPLNVDRRYLSKHPLRQERCGANTISNGVKLVLSQFFLQRLSLQNMLIRAALGIHKDLPIHFTNITGEDDSMTSKTK